MKNLLKVFIVGFAILLLSACSDTATPKADGEGAPSKKEEQSTSDLTLQEVFDKATAASEEQKSLHAVVNADQKFTVVDEDFSMDTTSTIEMDMVVEPLSFYQNMKMDMGEMGTTDLEMYVTEDGFFMNSPDLDGWVKFPDEMYEEMVGLSGGNVDPTLDMDMFKKFVEDFKFEQTNDSYILTLAAEGERFTELLKELMSDNLPPGLEEAEDNPLEGIGVKKLNIELVIDKETFYTTAFKLDMDMTMEMDGQVMEVTQKMDGTTSKFNEIEKIEIPQEVLDNAKSFEELMQ